MSAVLDNQAFLDFEAAGWRRVSDAYHRLLGPITGRTVEPLLDAAGVGPGSRVLDIATGPGYAAGRAAARGAAVLGVDIAPEMVNLARRLWPEVTFRTADAHDLPLDAASFDAVVGNFLVPHLADHERAVGGFVRVLAPGGRLALSTWDRPERTPLLGAILTAVRMAGAEPPTDVPAGPDFFQFSDDDAFRGLLQHAGLQDAAVHHLAFRHSVPSAAALWDAMVEGTVRTAALVRSQTAATQQRIRAAFDDVVDRYRSDTGIEIDVSVKLAAGRKAT